MPSLEYLKSLNANKNISNNVNITPQKIKKSYWEELKESSSQAFQKTVDASSEVGDAWNKVLKNPLQSLIPEKSGTTIMSPLRKALIGTPLVGINAISNQIGALITPSAQNYISTQQEGIKKEMPTAYKVAATGLGRIGWAFNEGSKAIGDVVFPAYGEELKKTGGESILGLGVGAVGAKVVEKVVDKFKTKVNTKYDKEIKSITENPNSVSMRTENTIIALDKGETPGINSVLSLDNNKKALSEINLLKAKGELTETKLMKVLDDNKLDDVKKAYITEKAAKIEEVDIPKTKGRADIIKAAKKENPKIESSVLVQRAIEEGFDKTNVNIEEIKSSTIKSNPSKIEAIKKDLEEGYKQDAIIIDKDNNIIDGAARLEAYKELGYKDIPVLKEGVDVYRPENIIKNIEKKVLGKDEYLDNIDKEIKGLYQEGQFVGAEGLSAVLKQASDFHKIDLDLNKIINNKGDINTDELNKFTGEIKKKVLDNYSISREQLIFETDNIAKRSGLLGLAKLAYSVGKKETADIYKGKLNDTKLKFNEKLAKEKTNYQAKVDKLKGKNKANIEKQKAKLKAQYNKRVEGIKKTYNERIDKYKALIAGKKGAQIYIIKELQKLSKSPDFHGKVDFNLIKQSFANIDSKERFEKYIAKTFVALAESNRKGLLEKINDELKKISKHKIGDTKSERMKYDLATIKELGRLEEILSQMDYGIVDSNTLEHVYKEILHLKQLSSNIATIKREKHTRFINTTLLNIKKHINSKGGFRGLPGEDNKPVDSRDLKKYNIFSKAVKLPGKIFTSQLGDIHLFDWISKGNKDVDNILTVNILKGKNGYETNKEYFENVVKENIKGLNELQRTEMGAFAYIMRQTDKGENVGFKLIANMAELEKSTGKKLEKPAILGHITDEQWNLISDKPIGLSIYNASNNKDILDGYEDIMDELHFLSSSVVKTAMEVDGIDLPQHKNYIAAYAKQENGEIDDIIELDNFNKSNINKSFANEFTGMADKYELDIAKILSRQINEQTYYVNMAKPFSDARDLVKGVRMYDNELQENVANMNDIELAKLGVKRVNIDGETRYHKLGGLEENFTDGVKKRLNDYLNGVAKGAYPIKDATDRVLTKATSLSSVLALGVKIGPILKQSLSFFDAGIEVGFGQVLKSIATVKTKKVINASELIKQRAGGIPFLDGIDNKLFSTYKNISMYGLTKTDQLVASTVFDAIYKKLLKEKGIKFNGEYDIPDLIDEADAKMTKIMSTGDKLFQSPVLRSTVGRIFFTMQSALMNSFNYKIVKFANSEGAFNKSRVIAYWGAQAATEAYITYILAEMWYNQGLSSDFLINKLQDDGAMKNIFTSWLGTVSYMGLPLNMIEGNEKFLIPGAISLPKNVIDGIKEAYEDDDFEKLLKTFLGDIGRVAYQE